MKSVSVYQLLIFAVGAYSFLRVFLRYIRKDRSFREVILSALIWGTFSLIGLFPQLSNILAEVFGFELGINFLLVSAVLILFYFMLRQSIKNDDIENTITKLVRNQALSKTEKKSDQSE